MKYAIVTITLMILFAPLVSGQGIQRKEVRGFAGGLVNSLANAYMQDNMAKVLENYDVDEDGNIRRRKGMSLVYNDAFAGRPIEAIIPYYGQFGRKLLLLRNAISYYANDTANIAADVLTSCDPVTATCTTVVAGGFYQSRRDPSQPFGLSYTMSNNNLVIASTNNQLYLYDGTKAFPAAPYGPGQPRVIPMPGGGTMNGRFRYKYCYIDTTAGDTSNFSAPSWYAYTSRGKVLIYGLATPIDSTVQDQIAIYRETDGSGHYEHLVTFNAKDSTVYLDTTAATVPGDTTAYPWGSNRRCTGDASQNARPCTQNFMPPPGGMSISIDTCTTTNFGIGAGTLVAADCYEMAWSIIFIDSAGRRSYMGPPTCMVVGFEHDTTYKATITNIPVPQDSGIVEKWLIRMHADPEGAGIEASNSDEYLYWYRVATLDDTTTTFTDSARNSQVATASRRVCDRVIIKDTTFSSGGVYVVNNTESYGVGAEPEKACYDDSVIMFAAEAIVRHGFRGFVIGNKDEASAVYYADFGRITTWPNDKYLRIVSQQGDWLNGLADLGDRLLLFRQNSVSQITGFNFFQFSTDLLIQGIGLSARRALAVGENEVFFAHSTGLYKFGRFAGITKKPISMPIQNSIDSVGDKLQQSVGHLIGKEYWWSLAPDSTINTETYIYSETPVPHWTSYNFGVNAAALWDTDTASSDFTTDRWIIARDNDSLYKWNYSASDTLDDTVHFIATYQSKYFFEGAGREKIFYVDLQGTGTVDSLRLIFLEGYKNANSEAVGTPFDTVIYAPDFADNKADRIKVNRVCEMFALRIEDFGSGNYALRGYTIGYMPWDDGRL